MSVAIAPASSRTVIDLAMVGFHKVEAEARQLSNPQAPDLETSIEDFVRGPEGLDLGAEPFPRVITTIAEIMDGGPTHPTTGLRQHYIEAFLEWGIGAGKDYTASIYLLCKAARALQGMIAGTFWYQYGLARGSRIELAHFAPDESSATEVLHSELVGKAADAPWFAKFAPVDDKMRTRIRFRRSSLKGDYWPLEIVPRGCSLSKRLGRNLYAATIDEANFWSNTEGVRGDDVMALYHAITRRLRSRFGEAGQLLMITSSNYDGDLSSRKETESHDPAARIYYSRAASWEIKPPNRYNAAGLTFDYQQKDARGAVVKVWQGIPVDLKGDFESDPDLALRDYAGVRYGSEQTFDSDAQWLFKEPAPPRGRGPLLNWASPIIAPYRLDPAYTPQAGVDYFLHFDLATSGDPRADGLGIAMTHAELLQAEDLVDTAAFAGEPYAHAAVVVDFAVRVRPEDVGGERSLEATRQFVYDLQAAGFQLGCVSYDGYQSTDSRQILAQHGVTTMLISVDRTPAAYQTTKRLLHAGRIIYGPSVWLNEYQWLRIKTGNKVDHLPSKTKDCSDSVAGAVMNCWRHIVAHLVDDKVSGSDAERLERHRARKVSTEKERQARHAERKAGRRGVS